jgi:hypothetical protein
MFTITLMIVNVMGYDLTARRIVACFILDALILTAFALSLI